MSKRDYINEILAKKQRSIHEWQDISHKLFVLESNFDKIKGGEDFDNSQLSLFLVGIVTCLEVATRKAIQRLVDKGTPYVERIDKFKDFLKIDLNVTKALHDKKVSFGELVSHLLPVNNVENIISHLEVLLDVSCSETLKNLRHFQEPDLSEYFEDEESNENVIKLNEEENELPSLMIDDVNNLISNLSQMFSKRHIIIHEANFETVSSKEDLEKYFSIAIEFANALNELIEQTINPNMPRHTMYLSVVEFHEAEKIYKEMEQLFEEIYTSASNEQTNLGLSERKALDSAQKAFLQYLEAETEFEETSFNPGTGYMMTYIDAYMKKALCKQRIERLKEAKEMYFNENVEDNKE